MEISESFFRKKNGKLSHGRNLTPKVFSALLCYLTRPSMIFNEIFEPLVPVSQIVKSLANIFILY
jgi:hypothetical protein